MRTKSLSSILFTINESLSYSRQIVFVRHSCGPTVSFGWHLCTRSGDEITSPRPYPEAIRAAKSVAEVILNLLRNEND